MAIKLNIILLVGVCALGGCGLYNNELAGVLKTAAANADHRVYWKDIVKNNPVAKMDKIEVGNLIIYYSGKRIKDLEQKGNVWGGSIHGQVIVDFANCYQDKDQRRGIRVLGWKNIDIQTGYTENLYISKNGSLLILKGRVLFSDIKINDNVPKNGTYHYVSASYSRFDLHQNELAIQHPFPSTVRLEKLNQEEPQAPTTPKTED